MTYQQKHDIRLTSLATSIVRSLRGFTSIFSACLALIFSPTISRAVDIDALVGFGQSASSRAIYRPETSTPLTVYLSGSGVKGEGQLQVTVKSNDHSTTYSRNVTLGEGAIKEAKAEGFVFHLQPLAQWSRGSNTTTEIFIQLLVDGRQVAHKTVSMPLSTSVDSYNVLGLTRYGSGLNYLQKKKLGLFHRHTNAESFVNNRNAYAAQGSTNGINPNATLYVTYTRNDALPVMSQGYDMMDAVALADLSMDNLTDAQAAALKGYVRDGGLLIVSGGGDLSRLKSQFYNDLLPITVTGSTNVNSVSELEARYREPLRLMAPIALVTGVLKPSASVLLAESNHTPLIIRRAYGAGTVVLTTFDYLDPVFRGWRASPSLWRDLLRCGNDVVSPRGVLASASRNGSGATLLADALAGKRATNIPGFYTVAGFLGAYLVLLIPISYFVLKRMDKRELAWYTAPALIAGFTLASYLIALTIKGGSLNVNRTLVLESQAGSDQFSGYAQMTVYSPRRANYDIAMEASGNSDAAKENVSPTEIFRGQPLSSDMTVEQNGATTLRNTPIGLWDKRSFDMPVNVTLGGAVDAAVRIIASTQAEVMVTNRTSHTINDCAILNGERQTPLGDLAPGKSAKAIVNWSYGANSDVLNLPVGASIGNSGLPYAPNEDSPTNITAKMRYAITKALQVSGQQNEYNFAYGDVSNTFGKVPNAVIGWSTDPLIHSTIDGKLPTGEETNLIFVHLPEPVKAPTVIATGYNPFVGEPAYSLDDELGPGGGRPVNVKAMGIQ